VRVNYLKPTYLQKLKIIQFFIEALMNDTAHADASSSSGTVICELAAARL